MRTTKANYHQIASYYDKGRSLSEQNSDLWLGLIAKAAAATSGARVLDLGCGTGRFALPMAIRLGFAVTGADSSVEMLSRAREKDRNSRVRWIAADASRLPFEDAYFDAVFMSHVLHHVDSAPAVVGECRRVLGPGGAVIIRYGAMDQIRNDVEHALFPGVKEIDEPRTPTCELTEKWLADAGFVDVSTEEIVQRTYENGEAHLEAARVRSTSVLSMITEESFQEGMRRLSEHVDKNPNDEWLLIDRMSLSVGRK